MMTAELLAADHTLGRLLQGIEGVSVSRDIVVSGLALDSRKVQAGDLFLAVPVRRHMVCSMHGRP